ncbi:uncharacterized protein [Nicotiana tomentosiformis]|uniref:uncharacterized protein n=1 Tax=Nicotiana tomentosiformis TaxID=4098 RepID=UPI00388C7D24
MAIKRGENEIGDINEVVISWEEKLQELEDIDIENISEKSREDVNKAHAQYIRWFSLQESLIRQKSQVKWFEEGDNNTSYFHSILRERRRRQLINRIKNRKGNWIKGDEKIVRKAVKHFQSLFNLTPPTINTSILNCIPYCISRDDNNMLSKIPDNKEIKEAVFSLSPHSTAGPDGFNDRLISKNVLLVQEIIHNIAHINKGGNYSVIVNGTRRGFFSSSQGIKQGDPLSPTLFIIAAEVLSRSLNFLYRNPKFTPFSMPANVTKINRLAYADDIVIFCSGGSTLVKLVMNTI